MPHITRIMQLVEDQIRMKQKETPLNYTPVQLCFIAGHVVSILLEEELKIEQDKQT